MTRAAVNDGVPEEFAAATAEETIQAQIGNSAVNALATPDGAIVVMVETYLAHVGPVVGGVFNVECPPATAAFVTANSAAISAIESHRSKMWKSPGAVPERFVDYVYYRTRLEVMSELGFEPETIGLDSRTVTEMVKVCVAALGPKYRRDSKAERFSNTQPKAGENALNVGWLAVAGFAVLVAGAYLFGDYDDNSAGLQNELTAPDIVSAQTTQNEDVQPEFPISETGAPAVPSSNADPSSSGETLGNAPEVVEPTIRHAIRTPRSEQTAARTTVRATDGVKPAPKITVISGRSYTPGFDTQDYNLPITKEERASER
jgi:hypothetical protein